jgi:dihydroorotate dehydrogenase
MPSRAEIYQGCVSPALDRIGHSETMHQVARELLHLAEQNPRLLKITERLLIGERFEDERLRVMLGGIEIENPVLVGAGWDKDGRSVRGLYTLGFAGVEVGSVLTYRQEGNSKPRQVIVAPGVAINWLGLPSPGMRVVARNLERYRVDNNTLKGISVAKNSNRPEQDAPQAFAEVVNLLYPYAAYFALNISCPNLPGEPRLQNKDQLTDIIQAVVQTMGRHGGQKPTFIKIPPDIDLTVVDGFIDVVITQGLTGLIATNTTNNLDLKARYGPKYRREVGGLSGDDPDFRQMATEKVAHIHHVAGNRLEIIGVGGVKDAQTALEKISAGARVVQVVTAVRGEGPTVARDINRGIIRWMESEGISSIDEIVGQNFNFPKNP